MGDLPDLLLPATITVTTTWKCAVTFAFRSFRPVQVGGWHWVAGWLAGLLACSPRFRPSPAWFCCGIRISGPSGPCALHRRPRLRAASVAGCRRRADDWPAEPGAVPRSRRAGHARALKHWPVRLESSDLEVKCETGKTGTDGQISGHGTPYTVQLLCASLCSGRCVCCHFKVVTVEALWEETWERYHHGTSHTLRTASSTLKVHCSRIPARAISDERNSPWN
ncbi:hypothetical protein F4780DRAFT_241736 [Xylariomycetidae sp. FL0641]|nr:hypothetical protein F4780DRAFT_241736 [Xylariomycetidae sp. FL0641]